MIRTNADNLMVSNAMKLANNSWYTQNNGYKEPMRERERDTNTQD